VEVAQFDFDLPAELIAQHPPALRGDSRLLCLDRETGQLADAMFADVEDFLHEGDLLVVNNTRVITARLHGQKDSGGKVELLVERVIGKHRMLAQLRASKSPSVGRELVFGDYRATVIARHDQFTELEFTAHIAQVLESHGELPLPPYIERSPDTPDLSRYQTVFAAIDGAVAAPTAGLHFHEPLLERLRRRGVKQATVTLHVGAGTFSPVRVDEVEQHQIHAEWLSVDQAVCEAVQQTRSDGGRVIAVGTTSVRALETAATDTGLEPYQGDTQLFIYPGYKFRAVDALITNFHLPRSSLLMLVCAFAGTDSVLQAYRHAVAEHYRFFSYGDAMFISRGCPES
tara:strand:- start:59 stop:1087 length:1029 start_codon:yes stop_codon:yes gene_type:complete